MNAALRGQHDMGEIVGYGYRLYFANFRVFFLLGLLTAPLQMLIGILQQTFEGDGITVATWLLQAPVAIVGLIVSAALIVAVHDATGGTPPDFSRSLDSGFERFGTLLGTSLLGGALAILGMIAAPWLAIYWLLKREATIDGGRNWWLAAAPGVLGVYLAVRWAFEQQAVMIAQKRNWAALDDSASGVRGRWWRTLGILFVIGIVQLGPITLANVATLLPPLPSATITSVVFALVIPFAVAAQTLLYYDLKARKQADASTVRLAAAGPDVPGEGA